MNNVEDPSQLCAKGCGFFASPSLRNMCSSCYCDYLKETLLKMEPKSSHNDSKKDANTTTTTSTCTRCDLCRRRVGLMGFKCRCGGIYCGSHRYGNEHSCAIDNIRKALQREALSKQLNAATCKADKLNCRF